MIAVSEALRTLAEATSELDVVELPIAEAAGHVLAETVKADRDFPPTDRSAMDGYALRAGDVASAGTELELIGELRAGQAVGAVHVGSGQAVRIMTGGIVPPGADAVVMVEKTEERADEGRVRIDDVPRAGQHVRRKGEDLERGEIVLAPGVPIRAAEIAALTSVGSRTVRVHRQPVVAVLSTGDEIVEPDRTPAEHQVRNSNAHTLLAQLEEMVVKGRYLGIAPDEPGELDRLIASGLGGDVLIITGGVSAGRYDIVANALSSAGVIQLFHKVAVKPGKPILAGRRGSCIVFGLPGNPVSTFATFAVFVAPVLRRMRGERRWPNVRLHATLMEPLRARAGREAYHLASIDGGADGLTVRPVSSTGSGDVLALARANGFVVTPVEGGDYAAGATVTVLPWRDLAGGGTT